jgi:radical SAM family RiPP maturation amino acid epimerase
MSWATTIEKSREAMASGEIRLLLKERWNVGSEYISGIAHTKRFLERWTADPVFRSETCRDARRTAEKYNLQADPEDIRLLWDVEAGKTINPDAAVPLAVRRYQSFVQEKLEYRDVIRLAGHPTNLAFRDWRKRQVYRTATEIGIEKAHGIVHAPIVFELSKGCSVGCWFCGVSAPKLVSNWLYNYENAKLWQEILEISNGIIGSAAARGFCYWATDPLDNPDYELFLKDFYQILGIFPQTTTAIAQRDPARVRKLLDLSESLNGELNRFSIISLTQLDKIFEMFSAEELTFVELVTQNEGTLTGKAVAGRARELRFRSKLEKSMQHVDLVHTGTIACVSGFHFSMVDKVLRLISPCNANEEWPLGYRIYDEQKFETAKDVEAIITNMIVTQMKTRLSLSREITIRDDLSIEYTEQGFNLNARTMKYSFSGPLPWMQLGKILDGSSMSVELIALSMKEDAGVEFEETLLMLNQMFEYGIFEENPPWRCSPGIEQKKPIINPQ